MRIRQRESERLERSIPAERLGQSRVYAVGDGIYRLRNLASPVSAAAAWQPPALALTPAGNQFALEFAPWVGIDRGVDGLVRDLAVRVVRIHAAQCRSDLPRRPLPGRQRRHSPTERPADQACSGLWHPVADVLVVGTPLAIPSARPWPRCGQAHG